MGMRIRGDPSGLEAVRCRTHVTAMLGRRGVERQRQGERCERCQGERRATKRAGLEGTLVHDFRRTAARDFRRAGVSEGEIMKQTAFRARPRFCNFQPQQILGP